MQPTYLFQPPEHPHPCAFLKALRFHYLKLLSYFPESYPSSLSSPPPYKGKRGEKRVPGGLWEVAELPYRYERAVGITV
jgi:hypothetical protein